MPDQPPALSDADLRETLDLLSTVVASLSDRMDGQMQTIDRLTKTAAETRQAAFAARSQTDPEKYGEIVAKTLNHRLGGIFDGLVEVGILLDKQVVQTINVFEKAEEDKWKVLRQVRDREEKAERLNRRLPWLGLGAVVLALAMTVAFPRFYAGNRAACTAMGAEWTQTTTGVWACVFYEG